MKQKTNPKDLFFFTRLGDSYIPQPSAAASFSFDRLLTWSEWTSCRAVWEALVHHAMLPGQLFHEQSKEIIRAFAAYSMEPMLLAVVLYEASRCPEATAAIQAHVFPLIGKEAFASAGPVASLILMGQKPSMSEIYATLGIERHLPFPEKDEQIDDCRRILVEPPVWLRNALVLNTLEMGTQLAGMPQTRKRLTEYIFYVEKDGGAIRQSLPYMAADFAGALTAGLSHTSSRNAFEAGKSYGRFVKEDEHSTYDHPLLRKLTAFLEEDWDLIPQDVQAATREVLLKGPSEYAFFLVDRLSGGDPDEFGDLLHRLYSTLSDKRGWIRDCERRCGIEHRLYEEITGRFSTTFFELLDSQPLAAKQAFFRENYGLMRASSTQTVEAKIAGALLRQWVAESPDDYAPMLSHFLFAIKEEYYMLNVELVVNVLLDIADGRLVDGIQHWLTAGRGIKRFEGSVQSFSTYRLELAKLAEFIVSRNLVAGRAALEVTGLRSALFKGGYQLQLADFPTEEDFISLFVGTGSPNPRWYLPNSLSWSTAELMRQFITVGCQRGSACRQCVVEAYIVATTRDAAEADLTDKLFVSLATEYPDLWKAVYWATGAEKAKRPKNGLLPTSIDSLQPRALSLLADHRSDLPAYVASRLRALFAGEILSNQADWRRIRSFVSDDEIREIFFRKAAGGWDPDRLWRGIGLPQAEGWKPFFQDEPHRSRLNRWLRTNAHKLDARTLVKWVSEFGFTGDPLLKPALNKILDEKSDTEVYFVLRLLRELDGVKEYEPPTGQLQLTD
ncbi:MAG: hypothetical protein ACAH35_01610 [Candidatus Paceibacterota bacterium]